MNSVLLLLVISLVFIFASCGNQMNPSILDSDLSGSGLGTEPAAAADDAGDSPGDDSGDGSVHYDSDTGGAVYVDGKGVETPVFSEEGAEIVRMFRGHRFCHHKIGRQALKKRRIGKSRGQGIRPGKEKRRRSRFMGRIYRRESLPGCKQRRSRYLRTPRDGGRPSAAVRIFQLEL